MKYTVVIPTRNRARYLAGSLASVLNTGRADVQIVVSDNSDDDQTEAVRAVLADAGAAVEYVRPDRAPVGMSANWEFALTHARGRYVTVIGDDDAILPSSLAIMDRVIEATDSPAVRWPYACYFWPDFVQPHLCDTLGIVKLASPAERYAHEWVDGLRAIREVADYRRPYTDLPMLYNSFVRKDVLGRLLDGVPPRIRATSPDLYTGFAVAHLCGRYVSMASPLGLQGLGAKSTGAASCMTTSKADIIDEFDRLNRKMGLQNPDNLPYTPTGAWAVAECLVRFHETYPEAAADTPMNTPRMVLIAAGQLNTLLSDPATHAAYYARLIEHYPHLAGRLRAVQSQWVASKPVAVAPPFGFNGAGVTVRPSLVGVTDVASAAKLTELILGYDPALFGKPIGHRFRDSVREFVPPLAWRWAAKIKKMLQ